MKAPIGQQRRVREAIKQEQLRKAAPALLEALEEITMYCLSMREHGHLGSGCLPYAEKAKAAIAAAKGEI